MSYTVKKLLPSDFNLLIPLMKDCFGMDVDIEYFKWKFIDNPAGEFVGFIAESEQGECAAYYGVIPELYNLNGKQILIYQSCDTMTHSKHRRKGLFQLLATHCYNYLRDENKLFVIGFGGGTSTPGFLKFGWKHIFSMRYLFRLKIQSSLNISLKKIFGKPKTSFVTISDLNDLLVLRNSSPSDKSTQSFSIDFLKWRMANPRKKYIRELLVNNRSEKIGYLIYYSENNNLFLLDYFLSQKKYAKDLALRIDEVIISSGANACITIAQPGSDFWNNLRATGFYSNPFNKGKLSDRIPFIFYSTDQQMENFNHPDSWEITPICHDAL